MERFQSTHSLRSATPNLQPQLPYPLVSIHALLAECDITTPLYKTYQQCFNPRTPCGVRLTRIIRLPPRGRFQSTHSLRSATDFRVFGQRAVEVSIHALLAECDTLFCPGATVTESFNPRTPCGVRRIVTDAFGPVAVFQSTHSLRSATRVGTPHRVLANVSIHALLAECDAVADAPKVQRRCFNPRTPCGVRRSPVNNPCSWHVFQSTHSLRSATFVPYLKRRIRLVSIHALLAECDKMRFYGHGRHQVSIHALLAECDIPLLHVVIDNISFNPRTPCGVRRWPAKSRQRW